MAVEVSSAESSEETTQTSGDNAGEVSNRDDTENPSSANGSDKNEGDDDDAEEEDEGEVYEVESILQERTKKGVKEYLVRWKGYDENWDTWEPEENLNCDDIIEEFKKQKEKKKGTPGRKRKPVEEKPKKPVPAKIAKKVERKPREPRAKKTRKYSSESEEEDNEPPATIVRCKTRFKKFVIEYAIQAEDDRDIDDDSSADPMRKYFLKYDMETGEFSVGEVKVEVNEESKLLICSSCNKPGPPWGRKPQESTPAWAKHLAISMKCHVIGQHLGGFSCRICDKNQLTFHTRTLRQFQRHMNEIHRRRLDMDPYDEEEDDGEEEQDIQPKEKQVTAELENVPESV